MSEKKLRRRKFLADLLFAGGGLTAAALIAKAAGGPGAEPQVAGVVCPPESLPTPVEPPPEQHVEGDFVEPVPQDPQLGGEPMPPQPEPMIEGKVVMPEPHLKGDVAVPKPECEK